MYCKSFLLYPFYSEKKDTAKDAAKVKRLMDLPQKESEASTSTGKGKRKNKDGMGWCWIDWVGGMGQEIASDRFYHL